MKGFSNLNNVGIIIHSNSFLDKETALVLEYIVAKTIPIIQTR